MATVNVTSRVFPTGTSTFTRNVPGNLNFSTLKWAIDLTQWTSPTTQSIRVIIDYSNDGGATWVSPPLEDSLCEYNGPDWLNRRGVSDPTMGATLAWNTTVLANAQLIDTPFKRLITTARIRVIVTGAPVTLSATITVN